MICPSCGYCLSCGRRRGWNFDTPYRPVWYFTQTFNDHTIDPSEYNGSVRFTGTFDSKNQPEITHSKEPSGCTHSPHSCSE